MSSPSASPSLAIGQRSLGDPSRLFPLLPVLLTGCPASSTADMQFPLEIDYDYDKLDRSLFDQAPLPDLTRWAPLLPPLGKNLSLGEGGTPLIAAPAIAKELGFAGELHLKDESRNPTWSHKDRLNFCTVSAAILAGAPGIAAASSGNHGAAAAAYAARAGLPCIIVTSPSAQTAFRQFISAFGAKLVVVPVEKRWPILQRIIDETGFMPVSNLTRFHTGNPYGPEGYKTVAYELFLQFGRRAPGTVVIPTGYGELLYGVSKGFRELKLLGLIDAVPKIVSAEPGLRGPLARALQSNAAAMEVIGEASLAAGIACTVSSYRGVKAIQDSRGRALTFAEGTLVQLREKLARQGLWQELSGVAGLAALQEAIRRGERFEGPVVCILTSSGLKDLPADTSAVPFIGEDGIDNLLAEFRRA